MKRHISAVVMALLCLGFFFACSDMEDKDRVPVPNDQTQAAPAEEKITVLNPLGTPPPLQLKPMAPRLDRMEGKTIYIVNDGYPGSGILLKELEKELNKAYTNTTFVYRDKPGGMGRSDEALWKEMEEKSDAMIIALGH